MEHTTKRTKTVVEVKTEPKAELKTEPTFDVPTSKPKIIASEHFNLDDIVYFNADGGAGSFYQVMSVSTTSNAVVVRQLEVIVERRGLFECVAYVTKNRFLEYNNEFQARLVFHIATQTFQINVRQRLPTTEGWEIIISQKCKLWNGEKIVFWDAAHTRTIRT